MPVSALVRYIRYVDPVSFTFDILTAIYRYVAMACAEEAWGCLVGNSNRSVAQKFFSQYRNYSPSTCEVRRFATTVNKGLYVFYAVKCVFLPQNEPKCVWRPGLARTH